MNKLLHILILIVTLSSCSLNDKGTKANLEHRARLPFSLYSFFGDYEYALKRPTGVGSDLILNPFTGYEQFTPSLLFKTYNYYRKSRISEIRNRLHEYGAKKIDLSGDNYFIIEREQDLLTRFDSTEIIQLYNDHKDDPLIPSFRKERYYNKFFSHPTLTGLSDDSELYIVKSINEFLLPEKYRYEWKLMPEVRRSGYVGGVILNEEKKVAVLWSMAW